jgi:DNA-binding CsgD family transcriptional regulator
MPYLKIQTNLPLSEKAERNVLIEAARALNERLPQPEPVRVAGGDVGRPGDDYNRRGDMRALLQKHGWTLAEDQALRYVKDGASGVLLKTLDPPLFVKCVRKVAEGKIWLPKQRLAQMAKLQETRTEDSPRPADTLTRREKTIINCLMQGWHNREISHQLSITEQTVKNHLRSIYDKVGASDRLELALYAIHQHLAVC